MSKLPITKKHGRYRKWLLWLYLTLLIVTVVAWILENMTGSNAFEQAQKRWKDAGETLDPEVFNPKPVSDDQNFCAIPCLLDIAATDSDGNPSVSAAAKISRFKNQLRLPDLGYDSRIYYKDSMTQLLPIPDWPNLRQRFEEQSKRKASVPRRVKGGQKIEPIAPAEPPSEPNDPKYVYEALKIEDALLAELKGGLNLPQSRFLPQGRDLFLLHKRGACTHAHNLHQKPAFEGPCCDGIRKDGAGL